MAQDTAPSWGFCTQKISKQRLEIHHCMGNMWLKQSYRIHVWYIYQLMVNVGKYAIHGSFKGLVLGLKQSHPAVPVVWQDVPSYEASQPQTSPNRMEPELCPCKLA